MNDSAAFDIIEQNRRASELTRLQRVHARQLENIRIAGVVANSWISQDEDQRQLTPYAMGAIHAARDIMRALQGQLDEEELKEYGAL